MDENKKNDKEYCVGPVCFHCGGLHGGKHILLRWAIGLAILALTFWMGVKIGELKSFLSGYGMHNSSYRSMPMMQGYYGNDNYGSGSQIDDRFWMMQ